MRVQLSTAIVLVVFIVGWVVLAALGKPIPAWMALVGAGVGKLVLSMMPALLCKTDAGSGDSSASTNAIAKPPTKSDGPKLVRGALGASSVLVLACGASPPPPPTPHVLDCTAQYQACVVVSPNADAYKDCRARVDAACLDGGAP